MSAPQERDPQTVETDSLVNQIVVPLIPPFDAIAEETNEAFKYLRNEFTLLYETANAECPPEVRQINQELCDEITSKILGDFNEKNGAVAAQVLDELNFNPAKFKQGGQTTLLIASAQSYFSLGKTRSDIRTTWGSRAAKFTKLWEFCQSLDLPDDEQLDEGLAEIGSEIVKPIIQIINDNPTPGALATTEGGYRLQDLDNLLTTMHGVDIETDFSRLRLACFASIVNILKKPDFQPTIKRMTPITDPEALASPDILAFYQACRILLKLQLKDITERYDLIDLFKKADPHKSRLAVLQSKRSKAYQEDCERMLEVCYKFSDLVKAQKWVQNVRERGVKFEDMRERAVAIIGGRMAMNASEVTLLLSSKLAENKNTMIDLANQKDEEEDFKEEIRTIIWENAIRAESIISMSVKGLIEQIKNLRLRMNLESKNSLREAAKTPIKDEYEAQLAQREHERIKPKVVKLWSDFNAIDKHYHLSGKKIRERDQGVISLAKLLSDHLQNFDREPMGMETARGLAGLMLGVYWERTGKSSTIEGRIQKYLDDADQLRSISSKLDELKMEPNSSLLSAINLLDEMIDGGVFDDITENPDLEEIKEFILAYISIRYNGKAEPAEEVVDEVPLPEPKERPKVELTPLPLEIIGQAEDEDLYVFPPGSSWREVMSEFSGHIGEDDNYIVQWERIIKIVELRDHCIKQGLEVNFMRTKQASWQVLPFFVLEVRLPGKDRSIAIVESPVYGNATYIFKEQDDIEWRDAVQLSRQEAREFGAVPAVHVDDKKLDLHKQKLWDRILSDLTTL